MFIRRWLLILFLIALTACDNRSAGPAYLNAGSCSIVDQNKTWFDYLQDWYLWYDQLPSSIDPAAYASVSELLNAVRVPEDRFSYVTTREEYEAFFNSGSFFGYGFSSDRDMFEDSWVIRYVFANSGAEAAGLRRGDRLLVINGYTVAEIESQNLDNATVFGPDEEGYTIEVTYLTPDNQTVTTTMVKGTVTTNTVFDTRVFATPVGDVGYLSFQHGFIEPSAAELDAAFATLAAAQPSQLILDLRYNGGGRISIAEQLGSLIGGDHTQGEVFAELQYNDKHQDANSTYTFSNRANKLDLNRVIILTTDNTCSASEMIINALAPHIEVVTVGTTTCGKPIGMSPREYCDMVMAAINFKVVNSEGYGDYFDGINSLCVVDDAIVADWGELADPVLSEGLYFAENSACSANAKWLLPTQPRSKPVYSRLLFDHLH